MTLTAARGGLEIQPTSLSPQEINQITNTVRMDPGFAKIYAIFDPDRSGIIEVLIQGRDLKPAAVWMNREDVAWQVMYVDEGW